MPPQRPQFRPELREWAVRIILSHPDGTARQKAIADVAAKIGCHPDSAKRWTLRAVRAGGVKPGLFASQSQRIAELEREVALLERLNAMLRRELNACGRQAPPDEG